MRCLSASAGVSYSFLHHQVENQKKPAKPLALREPSLHLLLSTWQRNMQTPALALPKKQVFLNHIPRQSCVQLKKKKAGKDTITIISIRCPFGESWIDQIRNYHLDMQKFRGDIRRILDFWHGSDLLHQMQRYHCASRTHETQKQVEQAKESSSQPAGCSRIDKPELFRYCFFLAPITKHQMLTGD